YDFFSHFAGDRTRIKWPNDIYWSERKALGILVENNIKGKIWQWAVGGIGVNINQASCQPDMAIKSVSLRQIRGQVYDIEQMARHLLDFLDRRYTQFLTDSAGLLSDYNNALYRKEEQVCVLYTSPRATEPERLTITVQSVDAQGRLW